MDSEFLNCIFFNKGNLSVGYIYKCTRIYLQTAETLSAFQKRTPVEHFTTCTLLGYRRLGAQELTIQGRLFTVSILGQDKNVTVTVKNCYHNEQVMNNRVTK